MENFFYINLNLRILLYIWFQPMMNKLMSLLLTMVLLIIALIIHYFLEALIKAIVNEEEIIEEIVSKIFSVNKNFNKCSLNLFRNWKRLQLPSNKIYGFQSFPLKTITWTLMQSSIYSKTNIKSILYKFVFYSSKSK
mgnify:CR=1 FL=1